MTNCYIHELCGICRKLNCDKRVKDYNGDMRNIPCDGICHTCKRAIHHHSVIHQEPFTSMNDLDVCVMYHLQKHHNINFYGRQGENSDKSLVEQAIYQVYKCRICTFEDIIIPLLKKLDLGKSCSNEKEEILVEKFLSMFKKDKICAHLQAVASEIISVVSGNDGVNVVELCEQIHIANGFVIHEITITPMISDLLTQNKIIKDDYGKYHIK